MKTVKIVILLVILYDPRDRFSDFLEHKKIF